MGFGHPEVERCLQAAFGNPDRAVEYLMNGIPDGPTEPTPSAGGPPPAAQGAPPAGGAAAFPAMAASGGGGGPTEVPPELARLRTNPQFPQLARMVAANPQMLAQILPALGQADPEAMQAVMQHPEAFMRMIQEEAAGMGAGGVSDMAAAAAELAQHPEMLDRMVAELLPQIEQSDPQAAEAIRANPRLLIQMLQQGRGMQPGAAGGGGGAPPNVIRLTEEENASVERLTALGFDRHTAGEAFLACDKDEQLAANFLFDGAGA